MAAISARFISRAAPLNRSGSVRGIRPQHDPDRLQQDDGVQERVAVANVVKVVFQLPERFRLGAGIGKVDLRPAGQTRLDRVAVLEIWMRLRQPSDEVGPLRARSDKAHLALEDAPELRQLVQMRGTQ